MKNIILVILIVISQKYVQGQITSPDTTKKEFVNVIGIDATGLLKQFFNLNASSYYNYPYMINYRRICRKNAIRSGVGGYYYTNDGTTNDSLPNNRSTINFNLGIGIEHYSYLSKKWNFYFGADAIFNYVMNDNLYSWSTTSTNKQISKNYGYGVSPLIGVHFKINSRISLSTETSYDITYVQGTTSTTYSSNPQYDSHSENKGFQTGFNAPTTINFRIQF